MKLFVVTQSYEGDGGGGSCKGVYSTLELALRREKELEARGWKHTYCTIQEVELDEDEL